MSPKDWFDVINGIIANVIAAAASQRSQTKTEAQEMKKVPANPTSRNLPANPIPSENAS